MEEKIRKIGGTEIKEGEKFYLAFFDEGREDMGIREYTDFFRFSEEMEFHPNRRVSGYQIFREGENYGIEFSIPLQGKKIVISEEEKFDCFEIMEKFIDIQISAILEISEEQGKKELRGEVIKLPVFLPRRNAWTAEIDLSCHVFNRIKNS